MELHFMPAPNLSPLEIAAPEGHADLSVYLLPASESLPHRADKPMVIVCPGGAYSFCSDREAEPIAAKYLAAGFHAAVLRYHCAPARYPVAMCELAWSVALCRRMAAKWHINTDAIFVVGFSAGGHLAASLGTLWDDPVLHACLSPDYSWRPNGQILCYPVITMREFAHIGSRDNLLGAHAQPNMLERLSLEKQVNDKTVPAFLWHTYEDGAVPVENSLLYASALSKHKIPFELHVFEKGQHGLSTCEDITSDLGNEIVPDNQSWIDMSIRFIRRRAKNLMEE